MKDNIQKSPKFEHPVLIDRILANIQDELLKGIGWLDYAFGRSQRLVTKRERNEWYYPGVYIGKNEYLNVLPGQNLGNRTFFIVSDPATLDTKQRYITLKSSVGLVCWYNLSTIYPNNTERNTEAVKWKILSLLNGIIFPSGMRMDIIRMYDQAENIFREYSLKEVDTQYLMQPYAGVRFDLNLSYREECYD